MPVNPKQPTTITPVSLASVLDQLACPACLGELRTEVARLTCTDCMRVYPVVDGIPVLIAERADS